MEDTITFNKTKNDGTVVKKKMPVFQHGDWKDWLTWLLHLQEHSTFMRYTLTQEDQFSLADDMQLLLFEEHLRQFNDVVREETQNRPDVAVAGIRQLSMRHCHPAMEERLSEVVAMVQSMKQRQDNEYAAMKFYGGQTDEFAAMSSSEHWLYYLGDG
eukprot:jgi/Phyca11/21036/fgenesh1_pg.PHYCAscaffold_80_\